MNLNWLSLHSELCAILVATTIYAIACMSAVVTVQHSNWSTSWVKASPVKTICFTETEEDFDARQW